MTTIILGRRRRRMMMMMMMMIMRFDVLLLMCQDLPLSRCDMMISELLDARLIGEGILPAARDARSRLLASSSSSASSSSASSSSSPSEHAASSSSSSGEAAASSEFCSGLLRPGAERYSVPKSAMVKARLIQSQTVRIGSARGG
jgi:hypothetical protein